MAKVGMVMGSDSDMPVMAKAAEVLEQLGIEYEMRDGWSNSTSITVRGSSTSSDCCSIQTVIIGRLIRRFRTLIWTNIGLRRAGRMPTVGHIR